VLSVGVDLAAEFVGTAVARLHWSATGAVLGDLVLPADDDAVVEAILAAEKAGIDCPLGWPEAFVSFVTAHHDGTVPVPPEGAGRAWRRGLAWRQTDEAVRALTGLVPLSVSADRIGHTTMRCAVLLSRLAKVGHHVDRDGSAVVVEVYPAGSLKQWGLAHRGYKRTAHLPALGMAVDALLRAAPWLDLGRYEEICRRSDHALDAVVAALTARAAWQGTTHQPDERQRAAARTEGWIAIPARPIGDLRRAPPSGVVLGCGMTPPSTASIS
jgi:predicted nuclease with RNAse H fold